MSDAALSAPAHRPASAVSHGVGIAGMAGLVLWTLVARHYGMDGRYSAAAAVIACGLPMLLWSLLVDKVHRNPTTGIDWKNPKPLQATLDVSLVKLAGLWATWGAIAFVYCLGRWYWDGQYLFAMEVLTAAAAPLFVLSVPYVLWIDRYFIEPRDGAYAFGQWLIGGAAGEPDNAEVIRHVRAWAVKGFFTAFMISIVPGNFAAVVSWQFDWSLQNPVNLIGFLISAMFLVDVAFATVGYMLTMKPLDAHIRSANPYLAGWVAALMCYPPFVLMSDNGPLDYHPNTAEWDFWLAGQTIGLWIVGIALVVLTGIYAWATVAFGLRFSNLTDRGILTHGPYAWSKHPAYLAKNLFWWLSSLPFLAVSHSITDIIRNSVIMALVSGVYYWRARTEEKHLSADPTYVAYAAWMEANAPIPRAVNWILGRRPRRMPTVVPAE